MKIICDSCGAKYSIADEKVAGKVFKIRCKKCSNMIVVKSEPQKPVMANSPSIQPTAMAAPAYEQSAGSAPAAQAAPSAGDPNAEPVWHVVVAGDQQGPFAPSQIGEMLTVGTIDWEAYVWREGFDGWVPARDVPELVEAITGQPYDAAYSSSAGDAAAPSEAAGFGDGPDQAEGTAVAASPFASDFGSGFSAGEDHADDGAGLDALAGLGGGAPAPAARTSNADLFGGGAAAAQASPFGGAAPRTAPTTAPDQSAMTGQRNENSVLFSLANLQALATESASNTASLRPSQPGHASGEGSGLIDIRALAAATGMGASGAPGLGGPSLQPQAKAKEDRIDDLMSIGTGSPLTLGNLGTPVLAPVRDESPNKVLYGAIAVAAVALLGLGGTVVFLLTREPEVVTAPPAPITSPVSAAPAPAPAQPAVAANTAPAGGTAPAAEAPSAALAANTNAERPSGEGAGGNDDRPRAAARPRTESRGGGGSAPVAVAAAEPERPKDAVKRPSGGSIDDLLNDAISGGGGGEKPAKKEPAASASDEGLPDTPDRDSVASALRSVTSEVKACGGGKHGIAKTKIVVSGATGKVKNAVVEGPPFAGTAEGSCIARAARTARFPRFKRDEFVVTFPFSL